MTEIHCPACSALLKLEISRPDSVATDFAPPPREPVKRYASSIANDEAKAAARVHYTNRVADALAQFVRVRPWGGGRLSPEIYDDFMDWLHGSPDGAVERVLLSEGFKPTKNKVSKVLVEKIGATWYKGPKGRVYRLPEGLALTDPAHREIEVATGAPVDPRPRAGLSVEPPAEVPVPVGGGLVPAAGVELGGEGSLAVEGVASLPLAEHVAAVRAQAAAEDNVVAAAAVLGDAELRAAVVAAPVDYVFVVKDGVRHKVPIKRPNDEVVSVEQEFSPLPDNQVLDGPSVFPVEAGAAPAAPAGNWRVKLTDAEAELPWAQLEQIALERLPERVVLAGNIDLGYGEDGLPFIACPVHSVDGEPAGDGVVPVVPTMDVAAETLGRVLGAQPVDGGAVVTPMSQPAGAEEVWVDPADAGVSWPPDTAGDAVERAAAAPLPSPEQLAAAAGHDALERARLRSQAAAAPVFLATDDYGYEGADPGDWG